MILPPKKMRGGIPFITRGINGLRDFILRTRVIPTNGFQETPSGVLPPPLPGTVAGQELQWVWNVNEGNFSFNENGGFVYLPYFAEDDPSTGSENQIPSFMQLPMVPEIGAASVRPVADATPPTISLTADEVNYIVMTANLNARDEEIGQDDTGLPSYQIESTPLNVTIAGSTGDGGAFSTTISGNSGPASAGDAHTHSVGSYADTNIPNHTHPAQGSLSVSGSYHVPLMERNYHWDGTDADVSISAITDLNNFGSDGADTVIKYLMGWVELDGDSNVLDYLWCAGHGPIHLGRFGGHVFSDETTNDARNPTPNNGTSIPNIYSAPNGTPPIPS